MEGREAPRVQKVTPYIIYIVPPLAGERWYAVPKGDGTCGPEEKVSPMEPLHGRVHRVLKFDSPSG